MYVGQNRSEGYQILGGKLHQRLQLFLFFDKKYNLGGVAVVQAHWDQHEEK